MKDTVRIQHVLRSETDDIFLIVSQIKGTFVNQKWQSSNERQREITLTVPLENGVNKWMKKGGLQGNEMRMETKIVWVCYTKMSVNVKLECISKT